MSVYNMSFTDTSTNIVQLAIGLNNAMGVNIGDITVLLFFVIYMVLSYRESFSEVLLIGSFLSAILATLFYSAGFASSLSLVASSGAFFVSLAFILIRRT
jgi:hypothetical protein